MRFVSIPYEKSGRTGQKHRTRNQLIAAARQIVTAGGTAPTVDEAAAAAGISRATAFRYFPNQKALLIAAHPEVGVASYVPEDAGSDPEKRLRGTVRAFIAMIIDTEPQQRTMLRLSLDPRTEPRQLPLRAGRAISWFEEALAPLELTGEEIHRVAVAVRSAVGIEALVWLTDVAGLTREQAARSMTWTAMAILREATTHGPPPEE